MGVILSKLRHPNIVTIYGVAFAENEMWIILEFLAEGNLFALLSSDKQISWEARIR
jgi:serine/threonine protein kinase